MAFRAIFFDLDDTLRDRSSGLPQCMAAALALAIQRYPGLSTERVRACFDTASGKVLKASGQAYSIADFFEEALQDSGLRDRALAEEMAQWYIAERTRTLRLFDETESVLQVLQRRFILGIISNGPTEVQRDKMRLLGIEHYFRHIIIAEEVGLEKPNPQIFRLALRLVGCQAAEMLFVGDSQEVDVLGAKAAGVPVAWLNRRGISRREHIPAPDYEIARLGELLPILNLPAPSNTCG